MSTYFENSELNYLPMVEALLKNPLNGAQVRIHLTLDTGFQGGVLIPLKTYVKLGLNLAEELKTIGRTALGGRVELRTSRVVVVVDGRRIPCHAYTAVGVRRPLMGREVLKELGLLYRPPHKLGFPALG